jgi:putative endonuclease
MSCPHVVQISSAPDPSLRLKNGSGRNDALGKKAGRVRMTPQRKETSMPKNRRFFVYIMTNRPRSHVLYTGVTGDLRHRVFQHKNKLVPGFTSRYNLTRLVYYEEFVYPDAAINREKEIKGWRRSKKIRLVESLNPYWRNLAEAWTDAYKPGIVLRPTNATTDPREIPHAAENRRVSG